MAKDFKLFNKFGGYRNKTDKTNIPPVSYVSQYQSVPSLYLVEGSQNVITTDGERIALRQGFTLDGQANATAAKPITFATDWITSLAQERNLRAWGTQLEFRYTDSLGNVTWVPIMTGLSSVNFQCGNPGNPSTWWDDAEKRDLLMMVNGESNIKTWSGATTTFASATASTITKQGVTTWAGEGILATYYIKGVNSLNGVSNLVLSGITSANTDNFILYWDLTDTAGTRTFTLYKNSVKAAGDRVCAGSLLGDGTITLAALNASGMTGTVQIIWNNNDTDTANTVFVWKLITIGGTTYSYTGGETTDTLTGVSPNPTLGGYSAGDLIFQNVFTCPAVPDANFTNDLIHTKDNQISLGSYKSFLISGSSVKDFTDYSFSNPRGPGQGFQLTLDAPPIGFVIQEAEMYISTQRGEWVQTDSQLSSDNTSETFNTKRLKTAPKQGAITQTGIFKMKNDIIVVTQEPTIDTLGRVENILATPQAKPYSDRIKSLVGQLDFTNCSGIYFKYFFYVALPNEGLVLAYNLERDYWESPLTLPISRFAIINQELYGHSNLNPETYKLFTGYNDNGAPINAIAALQYLNYDNRSHKKNFTEWFNEGYMTLNTTLNLQFNYNLDGCEAIQLGTISGSDTQIFCQAKGGVSLGQQSLGKYSLGGKGKKVNDILPPKFRVIKKVTKKDFYEHQVIYSSNDIDQRWELLAMGGNIMESTSDNNELKEAL